MSVVRGRRVALGAIDGTGERCMIGRVGDDREIGSVTFSVGQPEDGWLTIREIKLEVEQRGWGYGSEVVRLLEQTAVERGWGERFRAEVDARNGLGLYFWLRLGYRPAMGEEEVFWREPGDGDMLSMIRMPED